MQLEEAVEGYGLGDDELAEVEGKLGAAARQQLLTHVREAANTALSRLKDRWAAAAGPRGGRGGARGMAVARCSPGNCKQWVGGVGVGVCGRYSL